MTLCVIVCNNILSDEEKSYILLAKELTTLFTKVHLVSQSSETLGLVPLKNVTFSNKIIYNIREYSLYLSINEPDKSKENGKKTFVTYLHYNVKKMKNSTVASIIQNVFQNYCLYFNNALYENKSVCVFDLDDTIIDSENNLLAKNVVSFILFCKTLFDYVLLWSHGSSLHVSKMLKKHQLCEFFDLTISRKQLTDDDSFNKGIGYVLSQLNKHLNVKSISFSCLVDDLDLNFNCDYTMYVEIPKNIDNYCEFFSWVKQGLEHEILDNSGKNKVIFNYKNKHNQLC